MYDIEKVRQNYNAYIYISDESIETILRMYDEGYTVNEMCYETGLSKEVIRKVYRAYGHNHKIRSSKKVEECHKLVLSGMNVIDACKQIGLSKKTYYYHKNKNYIV